MVYAQFFRKPFSKNALVTSLPPTLSFAQPPHLHFVSLTWKSYSPSSFSHGKPLPSHSLLSHGRSPHLLRLSHTTKTPSRSLAKQTPLKHEHELESPTKHKDMRRGEERHDAARLGVAQRGEARRMS